MALWFGVNNERIIILVSKYFQGSGGIQMDMARVDLVFPLVSASERQDLNESYPS